jgi:branched-chain amino acid transport system permease protein
MRARLGLVAGLALLVALLLLPAFAGFGLLNVVIKVMIAAVVAMGFNLLWGQAGLLSFGHATYYAIGAFAGIYAMQAIERGFGLPTPLVPLAGALAGFVAGLVAGWFATLRAGVYFAMITVALAELVHAIAVKWEAVFGGEGGLRSARKAWGPFSLQQTSDVYWLTLAWTLLALALLWWLQRSPLGTVVRGIREREVRVAFLGYDTHALKTLVFAVSAAVSGLAGGLLALSDEAANMVLFGGAGSAFVVVNAITGGAGVFLGPVVGAALTTTFGYYVANVTHYWMLYLGLVFIAVVLYAPHGIAGGVLERTRALAAARGRWFTLDDARVAAGCTLLALAVILFVELIGRLCAPEYAAARGAAGGGWPPVRFAGVAWPPLGVWPWLVVLALGFAGARLVRLPATLAARVDALRGASDAATPAKAPT